MIERYSRIDILAVTTRAEAVLLRPAAPQAPITFTIRKDLQAVWSEATKKISES
jgi:hypothetical protein